MAGTCDDCGGQREAWWGAHYGLQLCYGCYRTRRQKENWGPIDWNAWRLSTND